MPKKLTIGILFGGKSQEHEVSLVSAESVMKNLDKKKYNIIPIGISKKGKWICGQGALDFLKFGKTKKWQREVILPPDPNYKGLLDIKTKKKINLELIFPVLHGPLGEDGTIQGLLELADLPYIGANVLASSVAMDKVIQKELFRQAGLPVVKYLHFKYYQLGRIETEIIPSIEKKIGYPCFIKPASLGSSVGISKVKTRRELNLAINIAFEYDEKILAEQTVLGREIECSVLGNEYPEASLPGEIIPSREFYDYRAKYINGTSKVLAPAPNLSQKQIKKIQDLAISAFKAIDCSGMARVDFFLQKKTAKIFVSEINTIPGFTPISMYPKLWQVSGIPYPELLDRLIQLALERHKIKSQLKKTYRPEKKWYR